MIYILNIKKGKVVSYKGETDEWNNGELRLINYCLNEGVANYITHDYLDAIQDYYNRNYEHCCWNRSKEDFEEEKDINYARITINGETRYYEEW